MAFVFTLLINCFTPQAEPVTFAVRLGNSNSTLLQHAVAKSVTLSASVRAELLVFDRPLEPLIRSLEQDHGEVECDCGMFVQIQARLTRADHRPAVLISPGSAPAHLIACSCGRDLAYARPRDILAFQILQNTSFPAKGQWLLAETNGEYLGLLEDGPLEASGNEWLDRAAGALREEFMEKASCAESLVHGSDANVEVEFLKVLYRSHALEDWVITPIRQSDASVTLRRKLRSVMSAAASF